MPTTILVTGGGGYVGARLVPRLLERGYEVRVLDWFLFGDEVLAPIAGLPSLRLVQADIRDTAAVQHTVTGCDAVIHLAAISNDPSFELDKSSALSINLDSFTPLVRICRQAGVYRFIFASTASVYGVSSSPEVTEDHPCVPVSDYNSSKAACEAILRGYHSSRFTTVIARPGTICGYSPRQRFDLIVNIFTNQAVNSREITVFGGSQMRPNLHIEDMVDAYLQLLDAPTEAVANETFNVGCENLSLSAIAQTVRREVVRSGHSKERIALTFVESQDPRSYRITSTKIQKHLGFAPRRRIAHAVRDLLAAFESGDLPDPLDDPKYFNIRMMQKSPF
jgi:nucleoside-diphosphate-sugar epimerase